MSKKRKDLADETAMGSMHQYFQNKSARVQSAATEDAYSIWGKSLIEDLKKVKSENKRTVLQITINRLVQDEILKQIEQESGETLSNWQLVHLFQSDSFLVVKTCESFWFIDERI